MVRKKLNCQSAEPTGRAGKIRLPVIEPPRGNLRYLQAIVENNPSPIFIVNAATRVIEMANKASGTFSEGEVCDALPFGGCASSGKGNCLIPDILDARAPVSGIRVIDDEQLGPRSFEIHCVPVFGPDNEVTHVIHYLSDVTRSLEAEETLRESAKKYHGILDTLPDMIYEARIFRPDLAPEDRKRIEAFLEDIRVSSGALNVARESFVGSGLASLIDGAVLYANRTISEALGYPMMPQDGSRLYDFISPESVDALTESFIRLLSKGRIERAEYEFVSSDGRRFPVTVNAILSGKEFPFVAMAVVRDATTKKQAEQALRESEERFRTLANQLPQTVFETDLEGKLTFVNSHGFESFGYAREDLAGGVHIFKMLSAASVHEKPSCPLSFPLTSEVPSEKEVLVQRKDGTTFPAIIYLAPITKNNIVEGLRGILVDITERKQLEAELLMHEKMESVSRLAGGIAHDSNNLLSPVTGCVSLCHNMLSTTANPPPRVGEILNLLYEAERAAMKLTKLNSKLMNLSQGNAPVKETASLAELVRETTEIALSGSRVKPVFSIPPEALPSDIDKTQIDRVITNIVTNASYAMPGGGRLFVSIKPIELRESKSRPLKEGRYIVISFRDEGPGIPADVLPKIFEPYFTTKGSSGTGLGLATSYNIVNQHGGHISVKSKPGQGTTFDVYLPVSSDGVSSERKLAYPSLIKGSGRILVMDDEDAVRLVTRRVLENLGYSADTAKDGDEAVTMYASAMQEGNPYSAVILDLTVVNGMGGLDAVQVLRNLDPGVRAIVSSGYSEATTMRAFTSQGFCAALPKPFRSSDLSKLLNEIIGQDQ